MPARGTAQCVHVCVCLHWFFFFYPPLPGLYHANTHTHHSWVELSLGLRWGGRDECVCVCVVWLICLISVLWILLIPLLSSLPFISPRSIPPHPSTSIICSLPPSYPPSPPPSHSPSISSSPSSNVSSSPFLLHVLLPSSIHFFLPSSSLFSIISCSLSSSISTSYSSYIFITSTPPPLSDIQQPISALGLSSGSVGGHRADGMVLRERFL